MRFSLPIIRSIDDLPEGTEQLEKVYLPFALDGVAFYVELCM